MSKRILRSTKTTGSITVREITEDLLRTAIGKAALQGATQATEVTIGPNVEVAVVEGYLCFWEAGREVRVGPFTSAQAAKAVEDLEYEAARDAA